MYKISCHMLISRTAICEDAYIENQLLDYFSAAGYISQQLSWIDRSVCSSVASGINVNLLDMLTGFGQTNLCQDKCVFSLLSSAEGLMHHKL